MSQKANLSRSITTAGVVCLSVSLGTFLPSTVKAAVISGITVSPEISINPPSTVNGVTYQGFSRSVTSFVSGGQNWNPLNVPVDTTVTLQRSGNAPSTADNNKQIVWERCAPGNCSATAHVVRGTAPTTTAAALTQNNIYLGTDNLFTNRGNTSLNQTDVERVDFGLSRSYRASADLGVTLFERGTGTVEHDAFAIAAIIGRDVNSNPIFGDLKGFTRGGWGTDTLLTPGTDYLDTKVVRKASGATNFSQSSFFSGQNIGGQLIALTDLVAANTEVFGYSLFSYDTFVARNAGGLCTQALLSSVTNTACYDYGTRDTTGSGGLAPNGGGIDLLALNLGVSLREGGIPPTEVPEPLSIVGTVLGGLAAFRMKKRMK